jgi:hypothetical protein
MSRNAKRSPEELQEEKARLETEINELINDLSHADLSDVERLEDSIKAMERLRELKERLPDIERKLAATA